MDTLFVQRRQRLMLIFFFSELAKYVWEVIFALFGLHWVLSSIVKEVMLSWQGTFVAKARV